MPIKSLATHLKAVFMSDFKELRLILGDQLNRQHSWFATPNSSVLFCMMEVRSETAYVLHHKQKILGFFAAMRAFAEELLSLGHQVRYVAISDEKNTHDFIQNIALILKENTDIQSIRIQEPDEYRLNDYFHQQLPTLAIPFQIDSSEHFLTHRMEVAELFSGKKSFLMERFYQHMRKKWNVLMDADQPMGGKWNFDASNRKKLPKEVQAPPALLFQHDLTALEQELENQGIPSFGNGHAQSFYWPINRQESLQLLNYFCEWLLPHFGDYQDAMRPNDWSLFHSRLSFALNTKMLHPLEVIQKAEDTWRKQQSAIALHQVEGFIRQILGWREYVRGIYWAKMPEYASMNALELHGRLPSWYWTGKTQMACLRDSIAQSLDKAYAHHIQRLMVTGNFALLLGVHPDAVDAWYLGIYIDAIEWVEMPNTRGMSQFADGGIMATKPYVSSANYLQKMSSYCANCVYDPKLRYGPKACPFNSLYWDFFLQHQDKLRSNPRIGMAYRNLDKMSDAEKESIIQQAAWVREHIEEI